jgi:uncharacterized membrane protein
MARAERVWIRRSVLLLACAWPLSLHYAILFAPAWPARVNAAALALAALLWAIVHARAAVWMAAAALVALLGVVVAHPPAILLLAPPVLLNAAAASVFGASLRAGHEPLINRFARRARGGELPPDLAVHARLVTWLWTLLLAGMAVVAAGLALWAPLELWSLFTNLIAYALIAALFIGEYVYRRLRFRHYQHASFVAQLRSVRSAHLTNASRQ